MSIYSFFEGMQLTEEKYLEGVSGDLMLPKLQPKLQIVAYGARRRQFHRRRSADRAKTEVLVLSGLTQRPYDTCQLQLTLQRLVKPP